MTNPFRPQPRILIFSCPACDNEFAQHRSKCKFVPGMGGDRFYCKCPVCGAECKGTKEETQR